MIKFCPLFSSSSGNSVYIGENNAGILVDVGRSAKQIREMLSKIGMEESAVKAVFLTHEHVDHIQGLSVFLKRNNIPVYASSGTLLSLRKKGVLTDCHTDFTLNDEGVEVNGLFIKPFKT
ncbi:MAG: MBL fold metallo-hydrolase, partial [Clostridia bacterium]|nr:MBL fold metallo-hydrolase [Clostridia bacterium]